MAEQKTARYMEMQMEELKAAHAEDKEVSSQENPAPKKTKEKNNRDNQAEIAKLYEDAYEYEMDLAAFESELEIVKENKLQDIGEILTRELPDEERNYVQELNTVLEAGWTHLVEVEKTHAKEELDLIKETEFCDVEKKLTSTFPDYAGNFESDIRDILLKRWEMLVAIKKEHVKEEIADIKTSGLKPKYAKRIYEQYHGIKK